MSRTSAMVWGIALAVVLVVPVALGQMGMGRNQANRMYDPETETTLEGTVTEVTTTTGTRGMTGVHVTLATEGDTIVVHLGPATFLEQNHFTVAKGDVLEVTGSVTTMGNDDVLLARLVTKGDTTVRLRDETGKPLWSMSRQRP